MFADDSTMVVKAKTIDEIETGLKTAITVCANWATKNRMLLNLEKTKIMIIEPSHRTKPTNLPPFTINMDGTNLEVVSSAKVLGISICSNLKNVQVTVSNQCKKIDSAIFLIRNSASYLNSKTVALLCNSFVHPHLSYCCEAWGPLCNSSQISQLNKLIKSCQKLCKSYNLNWLPFSNLLDYRTNLLSFHSRSNSAPSYLTNKLKINSNTFHTRAATRHDFSIPWINSNLGRASFSYRGAATFNSLPNNIKSLSSLSSFRKLLFAHIFQTK